MLEHAKPTDGSSPTTEPAAPSPSLSEISHLFLTGLRDRQGSGEQRPVRKPPAASSAAVSVDISPRQFADEKHAADDVPEDAPRPQMSAVLAHHMGAAAVTRVRQYARHVASAAGRVGLIELNDEGIRLTCVDAERGATDAEEGNRPEGMDLKRVRQALEEMSWDIDRWIVFLAGGAATERSRKLLAAIRHWTLLTAADDAGIVAAYRTLKSVAGVGGATLSAAVLNAEDASQERIIQRKLSGASEQFLHRSIQAEPAVGEARDASEHSVLWCRAGGTGGADHWAPVMEMAARSVRPEEEGENEESAEKIILSGSHPGPVPESRAREKEATVAPPPVAVPSQPPPPAAPTMKIARPDGEEVLELSASNDSAAILAAVMKRHPQWIACPLRPPMCAACCVTVDRAGQLHLLACGLAELREVSRGFGWLQENRELVKMAVPQLNIDSGATPHLTLFVDQADVAADQLAPILSSGHVTIQTYRRLRWGERTGLLLEAA